MRSDVLCVILGGGRGKRLYPLTKERCKPAVPIAGQYRLIDIPISNCLNSNMDRIHVLTQFNSESLNKHIARTYKMDRFSGGFVEIMTAEQSEHGSDWFQGTADAVRQCLKHFQDPRTERILILSGDQLYTMDFNDLIAFHVNSKAKVTIACNPVDANKINDYGIIGIDENNKVKSFIEKTDKKEDVNGLEIDVDGQKKYLASMGIYLFEKDVLINLLEDTNKIDFGKQVLPEAYSNTDTKAFIYKGYWRDIGTIKSFFDENLMLTNPLPNINMFDENWPFFTRPRNLSPAKIQSSRIQMSLISNGCIVEDATIKHSVMGLRSRVMANTIIEDSVIMGCDYYETLSQMHDNEKNNRPSMGIGKRCFIRRAIIDKNVRIGNDVKIINKDGVNEGEREGVFIKDGITIICKNMIIPDQTVI